MPGQMLFLSQPFVSPTGNGVFFCRDEAVQDLAECSRCAAISVRIHHRYGVGSSAEEGRQNFNR